MIDNINPDYYTAKAISPLEYIVANKMGFIEGNVVKYVSRYKDKNGIEDLKKAQWYLNTLISLLEGMENDGITTESFTDYVRNWFASINHKVFTKRETS